MACPGEGILTDLTRRLEDKIIKEVNYFRHFETHDREFKQDKQHLIRKLEKIQEDIEDAQRNNEYQIKGEVQDWIEEANNLIQNKAEIRPTRFGSWCPFRQYRQGKRLAQRTLIIKHHIEICNFGKVAHPAELLDMKYHASRDFIDFESRKTKFNQLVEGLEDGNHYMIGLQGMGGTGKTTLATQVGKQVEESKAFEKVIFVVVSNPPDVNKIRGNIARQLGLRLEEREEADHSKLLWSTIYNKEKKLLIILDDVWGELNLAEIGVPFGLDHKNCYVLITTRHSRVCQAMRCQPIIRLHTLADEEALTLFLFYTGSNDSKGIARDFVKECGGLPIAIVALAKALRNWPEGEWNVALTTLRDSKPLVDVDEDLVTVYTCLKLSYDNLKDEKAQKLFLLCSIFPEDYEIPTNLVTTLGIGSGIFGEADGYCAAKSRALSVKNKLIDCSLLLKVEETERVKMHDLVREVAQWIAKEDVQTIMDRRTTLKENKRFVFWNVDGFPNQFDGAKLEILFLFMSENFPVEDIEALFAGMARLRVLLLQCRHDGEFRIPLLPQSLLSLNNIHTLILVGWDLGDISSLKNLQSLVTLELNNCPIIELPKDIKLLNKLRWLGLRGCEIQKNNPFEVIKRCSQLEELCFVGNYNVKDWKSEDDKEIEDEIAHDMSSSTLRMFSIAYGGFEYFADDDNGLSNCFNPQHMEHLISEVMFKYFMQRAQVLELGEIGQRRWKCLVPDIIPVEDGGMESLMKLYLYERDDIECLIDNSKYHYSNTTVFSTLVELHLYDVGVKELYWGAMPSSFLRQLELLKLEKCVKLQSLFLDENLQLPHLQVMELKDCPLLQPSIFQPSTAKSLLQSKKELKSLIAYESPQEELDSQKNYRLFLPELKCLQIEECGKLEMVWPFILSKDLPKLKDLQIRDCEKLKYVFGEYRDVGRVLQQEIMPPFLTEVVLEGLPSFISIFQKCNKFMPRPPQVLKEYSKEKQKSSKTSAFSWAHGCCFLAPTKDTNVRFSNASLEHHTISQESCVSSSTMIETSHIRAMKLKGCSKLKSLFSVAIATTIMLEKLEIQECEELKDIITNESEDDEHLNCTSIFSKLQSLQISNCSKLEFIFPSTLSGGLQKLKSIYIHRAYELKYVFGKYNEEECVSNANEIDEPHIHLPALESLWLSDVPNTISIGIKKYQQICPSIQIVEAPKGSCVTECLMRQPLSLQNIREMTLKRCSKLKSLFSISIATTMILLEKLHIEECEELKQIITNEEEDDDHLNCTSIFPKLQRLEIWYCNKLEFIFPSTLSGGLQKLKSIRVNEATELIYVFGKYDDEECVSNDNENDQLRIHLPALETLRVLNVPKMINIGDKKYYMSFPSLQSIELEDLQEFHERSFLHLMASLQGLQLNMTVPKDLMKIIKGVQKLTRLEASFLKIEEVLDLEGVEIEGPEITLSLKELLLRRLNELRHIWKGPKHILSLHNLQDLYIVACKKLRAIFSVSIVKNLPQLSRLNIEDCDELVDIIEESDENHLHQICFPKLAVICIRHCNSLKCLFSIPTCGMFPKLQLLGIVEASELEQVFIHKKDDMQKMTKMEEVFPELSFVTLKKLPMLITICEGIDFQTRAHDFNVDDCPKYQETNHMQEGSENGDSKNQAATSALPDFAESKEERLKEIEANDPTPVLEQQASKASIADEPQLRRSPPQSVIDNIPEATTPMIAKTTTASIHSQSDRPGQVANMKETHEQVSQEDNATKEATIAFQSTDSESRKQTRRLEEIEEKAVRTHPSKLSMALISTNSKSNIKNIPEDSTPTIAEIIISPVHSQVEDSHSDPPAQSSKEAMKTCVEEVASSVGPTSKEERVREIEVKDATLVLEEQAPKGPTDSQLRTPLHITQSIKDTMQQGLEENCEEDDAVPSIGSSDSNLREQSTGLIDNLSGKDSAPIIKETRDHSSVQEEAESEKTIKPILPHHQSRISEDDAITVVSTISDSRKQSARPIRLVTKEARDSTVEEEHKLENPTNIPSLPNVIPSLHHQAQNADAGSSSISRICEVFQFVELNDGEMTLLAQALKQYPQLLLPHEQLTNRIIAFSYRVLVDIVVMLATKTPYTITSSEKSTLESNLREAAFVGFNKNWVDSVRARVMGADMSDVLAAAEEEIQVMEAELQTCDIALEHVRKQRVEAKERLAVTQRQLEMAQNEFEGIDSQMLGLLEDRKELICRITEFREIVSAKDRPFGI